MTIKIIQKKSPNFDKRPKGKKINSIIIHYTGMKTFDEAYKRLCDKNSKVSSHYLIGRDGKIINLVDEKKRAWHSGVSHWKGVDNLNDISIGIELENPGHEFGYIPYSVYYLILLLSLFETFLLIPIIPNKNITKPNPITVKYAWTKL